MASSDILLRNQPDAHLNDVYGERDYYWYLRSPEFQETFLKPIGNEVNKIGGTCLDVGCGEGWLSPFIDGGYLGIDASSEAITTARERCTRPDNEHEFGIARIEDFPTFAAEHYHFDCIIFGGIIYCLIKPEYHISFIREYLDAFHASHFIIYDLWALDTSQIRAEFGMPVVRSKGNAHVKDLLPIKNKRIVEVYKCR